MTGSMIDGTLAVAGLFVTLITMVWSLLVSNTVEAMQVAGEKAAALNRAA